jgi:hypothetical protein
LTLKSITYCSDFLQHDRDLAEAQRVGFRKAVKAGVKMSFGTDAGSAHMAQTRGSSPSWSATGMTPMQAIQAGTINAADLIGHAELFGSITVGKSADIIAVPGNPLDDIHRLEQVQFVMKRKAGSTGTIESVQEKEMPSAHRGRRSLGMLALALMPMLAIAQPTAVETPWTAGLDAERWTLPANETAGMVGLHLRRAFGERLRLGVDSFAAVQGQRGGFTT